MRTSLPLLTLLTVLGAGCGATPESAPADSRDDAITAAETQAGQSFDGREREEDSDPAVTEAEPAARRDVDHATRVGTLAGEDRNEIEAACHAATGYSHGNPTAICVTYENGKPVEIETAAAYDQMRAAAETAGVQLTVVSGFRTMAEQRALYDAYRHGHGNVAAPPGYSNHQSGHALDLNTRGRGVYAWLESHGAAYGFRRTVASEVWHCSPHDHPLRTPPRGAKDPWIRRRGRATPSRWRCLATASGSRRARSCGCRRRSAWRLDRTSRWSRSRRGSRRRGRRRAGCARWTSRRA